MEFKEQVREASPIEEIASQYTQLSKDGAGPLKGLSPSIRKLPPVSQSILKIRAGFVDSL